MWQGPPVADDVVQSLLRQGPNCSQGLDRKPKRWFQQGGPSMQLANPFAPKTRRAILSIAAAIVAAVTMGADAPGAEEGSTTLSPQALQEIAQLEAEIDRIEARTIERLAAPPDNQIQQIELLGKLMLYDKDLSVNRNEACAFCHMPETGFTGPVSELNRTTGAYPGSVRTRFSDRKPQTHAYAPLSPVLHYNPGQGDLVGGNFWDMRATGRRLGNPAAEQAQGPPTNPVEMGLPDIACAVYRASQRMSPCRRTWRGSPVSGLPRQQYRPSRQPEASLLWGKSARRVGLCRQSAGIVIRRWRGRYFSQQRTSTQPTLGSGSTMAEIGARQPGANSGPDTAQRGQPAES